MSYPIRINYGPYERRDESRITKGETDFMRQLLVWKKWDFIENEDILKELEIPSILDYIQ